MHFRDMPFIKNVVIALGVTLLVPIAASAQSVSGQATSIQATVAGITSSLGSTGWLSSSTDALGASALTGSIPTLGSANSLEAATISSVSGSPQDEVSSLASVANLALTVANQSIGADFLLASVRAPASGSPTPAAQITGLTVGGLPVPVSGAPNQVVSLPGLTMVINEVTSGASGTTVNALHITSLDGLVNVIVASATAGYSTASSGGGILGGL